LKETHVSSHEESRREKRRVTFDVPLAVETVPSGINDRGQIVGAYCMTGCRPTHDFLYDRGNFITIDVPFSGVGATRAFGINNRGQIVGNYDDSSGTHEFVYDENRFSRLGNFAFSTTARAVNDRGEIAGIFFDSAHHNFLYDRGQFNILPFPASAEALGINNRADIVGLYTDNFGLHGYVATK
jgi:probable HAF family extracellular repeat protein